ncbi:tetratricopeptide repeat protein (plasmid) [Streptomyces sp. NBC_01450]|uniref:AfsR/SARP family transcriptional regulator n=1 Tax=Streptomyces sp. NBC_01450 TaxID=2903871 RepID=UPI002E34AE54|nr:BTAD domain-containing putative transcriptional regulator [Streptomyces sp. NBC_01450]
MVDGIRFSVLGPVRAWRGPDEIDLGSPQQRALLSVLLLAENAPVPNSDLIDAVWGTRAPASAPAVVRTYVHRLRKSLKDSGGPAGAEIASTGDGYRLIVGKEALDLHVFRELAVEAEQARRSGDTVAALDCLQRALKLWHGSALSGVRGEYARSQRVRLGEMRLSALLAQLTLKLGLGAHEQVAAELTALVAEHPLDERLRELRMLSLYRSGRQAAALDVYQETRLLLADELNVGPGAGLRSLYERILRADAELLAPPSAPEPAPPLPSLALPAAVAAPEPASPSLPAVVAHLPPDLGVFAGRTAELDSVMQLSPQGTVVISAVAGMAGAGKTAFAVHWAWKVADRFPDGQLYLNLRGFDPADAPVAPDYALRSLLESLGAAPQGLPHDVDSLTAKYRTLLAGKRVLVLLDNARDAMQVRPLLPGTPGCLVIVTSRNQLTGLIAVDGATPLNLTVLPEDEARALLSRRLGEQRVAAEPDAVAQIIARCARLPLALAVAAARAAARGTLPLAVIAEELRDSAKSLHVFHEGGDPSADVRAVFSWSYQALSSDAARLFRLLALHPGPDVTVAAAASLGGHLMPYARQLLSELFQAHLLNEETLGRYFLHDLLRAYATELTDGVDSPEEARAARHRMFDHYLHMAFRRAELAGPARALIGLAPLLEGVVVDDEAMDLAGAMRWFDVERATLLLCVQEAATHRHDVHTWQLAWAMAPYLHLRGLWREEENVNRAALEAARRLGDHTAQGYAHRGLIIAMAGYGRFDEAAAHAREAIACFSRAGDTRATAESYGTLAWATERQGDLHAALTAARRSLALFRALDTSGDDRAQTAVAFTLNTVGWILIAIGRYEEALRHCQEALDLCVELGDESNAAIIWDSVGLAQYHLGQYGEAVTSLTTSLALDQKNGGSPWLIAGTLMRLGDAHLSLGDPEPARAAWSEGLEILDQLSPSDIQQTRIRDLPEDTAPGAVFADA